MTKFRPCIDLHNGKVKQIVGSTLNDNTATTNFISNNSSGYYAQLYKDYELTGGHIIMLGPNNEEACLEALNIYPMQVGGGINISNCEYWINMGATHVIVTSYLFENNIFNLEKLIQMSKLIGKRRIVVDLSCKRIGNDYFVCINKWQTITTMTLTIEIISEIEVYCDELLIHATHVEGMQNGMDIPLIELLSKICTIPVTYAGGATCVEDIQLIHNISVGKLDVTIGSALDVFGGSLSFKACALWKEITYNHHIK